jgi:hypothetical protein
MPRINVVTEDQHRTFCWVRPGPALLLGAGLLLGLLAAELERGDVHDQRHLHLLLQRGRLAQVQVAVLPRRNSAIVLACM